MAAMERVGPLQAMTKRSLHVSLVVFRECDPSIIYGLYDTLWAAGWFGQSGRNEPRASRLFEARIVAAGRRPLELVTGVTITPQNAIADVSRTDIVIVPNVLLESAESVAALDRRMLDWIRRMHEGGAQLCSVCGGALVLAAAGLLDGRQATTHWSYVPLFKALYPQIALYPERILVQSGVGHSVVCAGGASSWQDLALLLIARHGGTEEAIRISKLFLYQWHRDGQLPYASMNENTDHGDAVISKCQAWLGRNYEGPDIVAKLVDYSGLPKRTFDRRFKTATGYSPLAYVQSLRIEEAKQILETSTSAVADIARQVGYEDLSSFRRLFRRLTGMTPGDYRRKFQVPDTIARIVEKRRIAREQGTHRKHPGIRAAREARS